jgi:hypothetical protein
VEDGLKVIDQVVDHAIKLIRSERTSHAP